MLRLAIFSAAIAASTLTGTTPGAAYEGPWCLTATVGRSVFNICNFQTFEQCLQERSFYGGSSFCGQNPRFLPYWRGRTGSAPRRPAQ